MPEKKYTVSPQLLSDFASTIEAKPNLTKEEIFQKFPEFGNDEGFLQASMDYHETSKSGKYKTVDELNLKFPEFDFGSKKKALSDSDLSVLGGQSFAPGGEETSPLKSASILPSKTDANPLSRIKLYDQGVSNISKRYAQNVQLWKQAKESGDEESVQKLLPIIKQDSEKADYLKKAIDTQKQIAIQNEPDTYGNALNIGLYQALGTMALAPKAIDETLHVLMADATGISQKEVQAYMDNVYPTQKPLSDKIAAAGKFIIQNAKERTETKDLARGNNGSSFEALKEGKVGKAIDYASKDFIQSLPTSLTYLHPATAIASSVGMVGQEMQDAKDEGREVNSGTILAGTIKAGLEVATERMFGAGMATRELIGKLGRDAAEKVIKESAEGLVKKSLGRKVAQSVGEEVVGETANQIGSNAIDIYVNGKKNIGLFDGVGDAAVIALFGGTVQGGGSKTISHYIDKSRVKEYEDLKTKANDLTDESLNSQSPVVADAIDNEAAKINDEADKIADEQNHIGDNANPETVQKITDLNLQIDELEAALEKATPEAQAAIQTKIDETNKEIKSLTKQAKKEADENSKKEFFQGRDFMESTKLQPGYYTPEEVEKATKNNLLPKDNTNKLIEFDEFKKENEQQKEPKNLIDKQNDHKNIAGVPSEIGEGEKPVKTEPVEGASTSQISDSGVFQEPSEEISTTPEEEQAAHDEHDKIESEIKDVAKKRDIKLSENDLSDIATLYTTSQDFPVPYTIDEIIDFHQKEKNNIEKDLSEKGIEEPVIQEKGENNNGERKIKDQDQGKNVLTPEKSASEQPETEGTAVSNEPPKETGIKNAVTKAERKERGLPEVEVEIKRNFPKAFEAGKKMVDNNEIDIRGLSRVWANSPRPLSAEESVALIYDRMRLQKEHKSISDDIDAALSNGDAEKATLEGFKLAQVEENIQINDEAARRTGYEQGLGLAVRRMMIKEDYSLAALVQRAKVISGSSDIPAEVRKKLKDLSEKLEIAEKKLSDFDANKYGRESKKAIEDNLGKITIEVKNTRKRVKLSSEEIKAKQASLIAQAKEILKRNKKNLDVQLPDIIPMNEEGVKRNPELVDKELIPLLKDMQRLYVEDAINTNSKVNADDMVADIYDQLGAEDNDFSKEDLRDAISGYGKTRRLSQEEIDIELRKLNRELRDISALEFINAGERPLKSGYQRDKLTQEERSRAKDIKQKIREKGLELERSQRSPEEQYATALDAIKTRLKNRIEDLNKQILDGKKSPKKVGVALDEEAKILKEEADRLSGILESIEGKQEMSDEQRIQLATNAVEKGIAEYDRRISELDFSKKEAKKTQETPELKLLRERRESLKKEYEKLKPQALIDAANLDAYKKRIGKRIEDLKEKLRTGNFEKIPPKKVPMDAEANRLRSEVRNLKEKADVEIEKIKLANRSKWEKFIDSFYDAINVPKALITSFDLSAPFRQGLVFISKPKQFASAFKEMFKFAFSEKGYQNWFDNFKESDDYLEMKANGLYVSEPTVKLTAKEEAYMSNLIKWFEKIPVYGNLLRGSERAYVGFLNKLRVDVYNDFKDKLVKDGFTGEELERELKGYSKFINNATGRGNLGSRLEGAAPALNAVFFSPRLIASRVNTLNPMFYAKLPPRARREAAKNFLIMAGAGIATLSLISMAWGCDDDCDDCKDCVKVELDPRSSDFGKIQYNNFTFDIWGGYQQVVRTLVQLGSGQIKKDGEVYQLDGEDYYGQTRLTPVKKFFENKLSPGVGLAYDELTDYERKAHNEPELSDKILQQAIPIIAQDIYEAGKSEGLGAAIATGTPTLFGIGVIRKKPDQ